MLHDSCLRLGPEPSISSCDERFLEHQLAVERSNKAIAPLLNALEEKFPEVRLPQAGSPDNSWVLVLVI